MVPVKILQNDLQEAAPLCSFYHEVELLELLCGFAHPFLDFQQCQYSMLD